MSKRIQVLSLTSILVFALTVAPPALAADDASFVSGPNLIELVTNWLLSLTASSAHDAGADSDPTHLESCDPGTDPTCVVTTHGAAPEPDPDLGCHLDPGG